MGAQQALALVPDFLDVPQDKIPDPDDDARTGGSAACSPEARSPEEALSALQR